MNNQNDKLEQILKELYEIDPALQQYDSQVRNIISQMLASQPDTKFDAAFAASLRQKLISGGQSNNKPQTNPVRGPMPRGIGSRLWRLTSNGVRFAGLALAAIVLVLVGYNLPKKDGPNGPGIISTDLEGNKKESVEVKKFASKEEFLAYLENAQASGGYGMGGGFGGAMPMLESRDMALNAPAGMGESPTKQTASPVDRVSETNVQVKGIDEPDIVKTNGKEIFVSSPNYYNIYAKPLMEAMPIEGDLRIWPPVLTQPQETKVINALPADQIKQIGKLPRQGEMLLVGDNLIIFENNYVYGFNIKKPEAPEEKWKVRLENSSLSAARLLDGKVYLVTQSFIDYGSPCPIRPLYIEGKNFEIACTDIYHPLVPISDTTTYHAFRLSPTTGEIEKTVSFVGSSGQSVVYMSGESLYISYVYSEDQVKVLANFLKSTGQGLLPQTIIDRINKLLSYDISSSAKQVELSNILQKHYGSLSQDDRRKLENDMENKLAEYTKAHMRELLSTGLIKIALKDFEVKATGQVPGSPLNQFSLDEFEGNLRIATTINSQGTIWGGWRSDSSANDVYVLNGDLEVVGSIKDLGLTERIYSARFVGKRGFLVTFKQIDPFYVLDLSNPKNPKMTGELKIPGFSSYLHPLKENLILGVGQENGRVKLSLFDVADSSNPKEIDKYTLDEYWSEAQNNHNAFLQDEKYEVFFLPGGQTGYVFSYKNNRLSLEKAVGQIQAQRALYVNDFLYVIGSDRIVVLNEKNWERVGELVY